MSEIEKSPNVENNTQTKTPSKATPTKRLSSFERARAESEELLKSMGASIEGGRRTRSSTRGAAATPSPSPSPQPKRARVSTPRRGKKAKEEEETESNNVNDNEATNDEEVKGDQQPSKNKETENNVNKSLPADKKDEVEQMDVDKDNGIVNNVDEKVTTSEQKVADDKVDGAINESKENATTTSTTTVQAEPNKPEEPIVAESEQAIVKDNHDVNPVTSPVAELKPDLPAKVDESKVEPPQVEPKVEPKVDSKVEAKVETNEEIAKTDTNETPSPQKPVPDVIAPVQVVEKQSTPVLATNETAEKVAELSNAVTEVATAKVDETDVPKKVDVSPSEEPSIKSSETLTDSSTAL